VQHLTTVSAFACFAILSVLSPAHAAPACKQGQKMQIHNVHTVSLPIKLGSGEEALVPTRAFTPDQSRQRIGVCEFTLSPRREAKRNR
jgi:hypothetical protein